MRAATQTSRRHMYAGASTRKTRHLQPNAWFECCGCRRRVLCSCFAFSRLAWNPHSVYILYSTFCLFCRSQCTYTYSLKSGEKPALLTTFSCTSCEPRLNHERNVHGSTHLPPMLLRAGGGDHSARNARPHHLRPAAGDSRLVGRLFTDSSRLDRRLQSRDGGDLL